MMHRNHPSHQLSKRLFSSQANPLVQSVWLGFVLCALVGWAPTSVLATPGSTPQTANESMGPPPPSQSKTTSEAAPQKVAQAEPKAMAAKPAKPKSIWGWKFGGYIMTGYRLTLNDEALLRLGDSDGFYVSRARMGLKLRVKDFRAVISIDGIFDRRADPFDVSPATRQLFVELRDAFVNYTNPIGFYVSVGQNKVPFGMHSDRSATKENFINFPLIAVGEDIAFGYQVRAIMPGRDIGVLLGFDRGFGLVNLKVEASVFNGNGPNRFGNDSDIPAVAARLRLDIGTYFHLGGSFMFNQRRVGELPNLFDETDLVFGADLGVRVAGFFLEGEFAARQTTFQTTGQESDFAFGFRADIGYKIPVIHLEIVARVEMYDPSGLFDDDMLLYITGGLNWYYTIWRQHQIVLRLNYIAKLELNQNRTLNNDQVNLMVQYRY